MSEIPTDLQEALKDRYQIVRELGRGGMAVVYLARDLKLQREVAIKVLIPDLAMAMGPERFNREIEIAGHLSHPHILPVYDSGSAEGRLYYVMPYVAGESLRARLDREKQLTIPEALRLSIEVARALDYAHKQGVVHRDIKPENILLEGGNAVVADFGIARAVSSMAEGQALTQTGMTLGTAAYMSPEQVAAEKQIDGRSDVYSLACVTYEMLAGHPPFTGPTAVAVMARQAMEMPPSMTVIRNTIPDEVEETVFQALAKSPVDRFENSGEFADALQECLDLSPKITRRHPTLRATQSTLARRRVRRRRNMMLASGIGAAVVAAALIAWRIIAGGTSPANAATGMLDRRSIGVLYFNDLSRDSSLGHVADALTEGLISELSTVSTLDVVSRNGAAEFRNSALSKDSIARALGTGTLVHGSVEPDGNSLRVTTWLIEGNSGSDMDRRTFTLPATRLLAVRDSVVREVALLLREQLREEVRVRESRAGTANVDAWALVQRAERVRKDAVASRDGGALDSAIVKYARADSLAQLAQRLDDKWPEAVTLRAQLAYERASMERDIHARQALLDTVVQRTTHALTLDREYAAALSLRGRAYRTQYILNLSADPAARARLLDSAQADLEAATKADGTQAEALFALSQVHYDRKDNVSALIVARQAYEADAFLRNQHINLRQLFWTHYDLEQFDHAENWCLEGARRFPQNYLFAECQLWMMIAPGKKPDIDRAWKLAADAERLAPAQRRPFEAQFARLIVAGALAHAGQADSSRNVLKSVQSTREIDPEQDLVGYSAIVHILLGDHDEAIELLKNYVVLHPTHEFTVVGRDLHWWWRPLKDKAGFQSIVARRGPA
ncbi:MAG TPA: protein kinase [Gemmatimonadaceae bacterium]|nr:protein kinase [Gemmatimonadaceae bacterium]